MNVMYAREQITNILIHIQYPVTMCYVYYLINSEVIYTTNGIRTYKTPIISNQKTEEVREVIVWSESTMYEKTCVLLVISVGLLSL